jgi:hypothetical protein
MDLPAKLIETSPGRKSLFNIKIINTLRYRAGQSISRNFVGDVKKKWKKSSRGCTNDNGLMADFWGRNCSLINYFLGEVLRR